MISEHFRLFSKATIGVHAEPIAALAALKLASLALHSTHSPRYEFRSRAARAKLDSTHHSRSL